MRIVVTMANDKRYEIMREDHDQFLNTESGAYSAIPAVFWGYYMYENGGIDFDPTSLLGIDVRRVNRT